MAKEKIEIGRVGRKVAERIAAQRKALGLTQAGLADRLSEYGRPMSQAVIGEIERAARRIDVDDLVALAGVLETPPGRLIDGESTEARLQQWVEKSALERRTEEEVARRLPEVLEEAEKRFEATMNERVAAILQDSMARALANQREAHNGDDQ